VKAYQPWQPLYEAEDAVLNDIALLPATTVVTVETEYGREVVAFADVEVDG